MAGTNKTLAFGQPGILQTYQETLAAMQAAYNDSIGWLTKAFGPYVILEGLVLASGSYSAGVVIIDGVAMPCGGGSSSFSNIAVDTAVIDEEFRGGVFKPFYNNSTAVLTNTGGTPIANFVRLTQLGTISQNLATAITNLATLTANFNAHTHSWSQITNRPKAILYVGEKVLGDILTADQLVSVDFPAFAVPPGGTWPPYMVLGSFRSYGAWDLDNDISWSVKDPLNGTFNLAIREISPAFQNLRFEYCLIEK